MAMSGGVDSSVAAALLKKAGFEVTGVFMRFWRDPALQRWNRCCSPEAEKRARRIALLLGIPFYVLNLEKEFKKKVVDYFLKEHKKGLTPNPCVVCNKEIKFGLLLKKALASKANYIATGHYVKNEKKGIRYRLLRAKDKEKDQSYFLWQLNQGQLKKIIFPLGNYTKKETISLAKKLRLPVSGLPESQEVCFIQSKLSDFLSRYIKQKPGKIVNDKRKTIGQHQGLIFYTIGQRKGIGLPGGPYFVLDKNLKQNILVVTKKEKNLDKKELKTGNINWISGQKPKLSLRVKVKTRYRQKLAPAVIKFFKRGILKVSFNKPQRAITPGQSVVFYHKKELLGGGIIKRI